MASSEDKLVFSSGETSKTDFKLAKTLWGQIRPVNHAERIRDLSARSVNSDDSLNQRLPKAPPPQPKHMLKTYRYYIKHGGSTWSDPYHCPSRRKHLIETPTSRRGQRQWESFQQETMMMNEQSQSAQKLRVKVAQDEQRMSFHLQQNFNRVRESTANSSIRSASARGGHQMSSSSLPTYGGLIRPLDLQRLQYGYSMSNDSVPRQIHTAHPHGPEGEDSVGDETTGRTFDDARRMSVATAPYAYGGEAASYARRGRRKDVDFYTHRPDLEEQAVQREKNALEQRTLQARDLKLSSIHHRRQENRARMSARQSARKELESRSGQQQPAHPAVERPRRSLPTSTTQSRRRKPLQARTSIRSEVSAADSTEDFILSCSSSSSSQQADAYKPHTAVRSARSAPSTAVAATDASHALSEPEKVQQLRTSLERNLFRNEQLMALHRRRLEREVLEHKAGIVRMTPPGSYRQS